MTAFLAIALSGLVAQPTPAPTVESAEGVLRTALGDMMGRQRNGGWVTKWSADNEIYWGEYRPVPEGWITVQPPATPGVAEVFLRAAKVLGDDAYLAAAKAARDALAHIQTQAGGFPHEGDPSAGPAAAGTLDDDTTTGALRFLIAWWRHTDAPEDRRLVKNVGDFLVTAQYESGGWPQYFPYREDHYNRCITFNDGDMVNAIRALYTLHEVLQDNAYEAPALRGAECILRLQGGEGEAIWAQQYDPDTLEPAWARKFEPPGYSASESRGVCNLLAGFYVRYLDEKYIESIRGAVDWYDTHRNDDGTWYRLYEPKTHRPVFGRRDIAVPVYDRAEATEGYSWEGRWYPQEAADLLKAVNQGDALPPRPLGLSISRGTPPYERAREAAAAAIAAVDEHGRWSAPPNASESATMVKVEQPEDLRIVSTQSFVTHAHELLDWIEYANTYASAAQTAQ